MSKKDIDHGRPRIVCTRMIESGTCGNRDRFHLDDIECIVIEGLRAELATADAIAYFVERYNAERRRSAAGNLAAVSARSKATSPKSSAKSAARSRRMV